MRQTDTRFDQKKDRDMRKASTGLASVPADPAVVPLGNVIQLREHRRTRMRLQERPMRCVSSGYMSDGCSCDSTIPSDIVAAAWAREVYASGQRQDRFFQFSWRGDVWLGFGLRSGEVRGVYCPIHCAEREARYTPSDEGARCAQVG
jgi:hypothetical protein